MVSQSFQQVFRGDVVWVGQKCLFHHHVTRVQLSSLKTKRVFKKIINIFKHKTRLVGQLCVIVVGFKQNVRESRGGLEEGLGDVGASLAGLHHPQVVVGGGVRGVGHQGEPQTLARQIYVPDALEFILQNSRLHKNQIIFTIATREMLYQMSASASLLSARFSALSKQVTVMSYCCE